MAFTKQSWILEAEKHLGLKEVPGKASNPTILKWLKTLKAWWSEDSTPWCGTFVAHCFQQNKYDLPKHWYRAKDWLNWGQMLESPIYGCVVVFDRKGGGHVGFVVGVDEKGNLMVLGGNQGDEVNIRAFPRERVAGYRYPMTIDVHKIEKRPMPVYKGTTQVSTNEA